MAEVTICDGYLRRGERKKTIDRQKDKETELNKTGMFTEWEREMLPGSLDEL